MKSTAAASCGPDPDHNAPLTVSIALTTGKVYGAGKLRDRCPLSAADGFMTGATIVMAVSHQGYVSINGVDYFMLPPGAAKWAPFLHLARGFAVEIHP